jgi:hypothetical protein
MLQAIIAGQTDARKLAALSSEQLSASRETLAQALRGKITAHHRFLLKQHLQMIEHLEQTAPEFEAQIEAALEPFRAAVERLITIPGVSATAASAIIAEIGVDMSRFATAGHLRSWAGQCPQLKASAGKIMSRRLRYGDPWLKTVLVQSAWAATRSRPVPEAACSTRPEKGYPCSGGLDPHVRLLFASRSGAVSRPGFSLFRPPRPGSNRSTSRTPNQRARLRSPNSKSRLVKNDYLGN